jgi:hypothetical protein
MLDVVVVPVALHVMSFARLARWLGGPSDRPTVLPSYRINPVPAVGPSVLTSNPTLVDAELADWVDRLLFALPGPWKHTCLKRSAVLYHLLRRDGREVELCIGAKRDASGAFTAHAWLVRDGVPYLERNPGAAESYQLLTRFPESRPHGG